MLIAEHASNRLPTSLGTLGLEASDLERHIAWDIGAEQVARRLSQLIDAPLLLQRYSRLAYDCNRPPDAADAMLMASTMGATAFQRGLGAIHALSHPFGGLYDAHHGTLNGIIML